MTHCHHILRQYASFQYRTGFFGDFDLRLTRRGGTTCLRYTEGNDFTMECEFPQFDTVRILRHNGEHEQYFFTNAIGFR